MSDEYATLRAVLDRAFEQASEGKGKERHAGAAERFEDQQIVQLGEWMGSNHFQIGQACKKALESTRLPPEQARRELLGAINYLAAAVVQIERARGGEVKEARELLGIPTDAETVSRAVDQAVIDARESEARHLKHMGVAPPMSPAHPLDLPYRRPSSRAG